MGKSSIGSPLSEIKLAKNSTGAIMAIKSVLKTTMHVDKEQHVAEGSPSDFTGRPGERTPAAA
jgi:hypothetical protein